MYLTTLFFFQQYGLGKFGDDVPALVKLKWRDHFLCNFLYGLKTAVEKSNKCSSCSVVQIYIEKRRGFRNFFEKRHVFCNPVTWVLRFVFLLLPVLEKNFFVCLWKPQEKKFSQLGKREKLLFCLTVQQKHLFYFFFLTRKSCSFFV